MAYKFFKIPTPIGEFGVSPRVVITGAAISVVKSKALDTFIGEPLESDDVAKISLLGTPVIDVVRLSVNDNKYIDLFNNTIDDVSPVEFDTCLLEISKPRNIVKTAIQGRSGTIKEYISDGDYVISGNAIVSSKDNRSPKEFIRNVELLFAAPVNLEVSSAFLNDAFNITKLVIDEHKVSQMEGYRNTVTVSFTALSDSVIEVLDLNELNNPPETVSEYTFKYN